MIEYYDHGETALHQKIVWVVAIKNAARRADKRTHRCRPEEETDLGIQI